MEFNVVKITCACCGVEDSYTTEFDNAVVYKYELCSSCNNDYIHSSYESIDEFVVELSRTDS